SLAIPGLPPYDGTHIRDLLIAIAVGILAGIAVMITRGLAGDLARRGEARVGMAPMLLVGGLAVGVIAQSADGLGANSQDVLFSGQASVPAEVATGSAKILLILLVAKGLAYAISLGCGFRGGPVFPAIFLGVALAEFAHIWFDVSPTLVVAAGAAAGMAAM